jgi:hypothetical protein
VDGGRCSRLRDVQACGKAADRGVERQQWGRLRRGTCAALSMQRKGEVGADGRKGWPGVLRRRNLGRCEHGLLREEIGRAQREAIGVGSGVCEWECGPSSVRHGCGIWRCGVYGNKNAMHE